MDNVLLKMPALLDGLRVGEWVAISESRQCVLEHGDNLATVFENAHKQGESTPLMFRISDPSLQMCL